MEYSKTNDVAYDRRRIFADFQRIINNETLEKQRQIYEFDSLVYKNQANAHQLSWANFEKISQQDKTVLGLNLEEEYEPFFVTPNAAEEEVFACLNRCLSLETQSV